MLKYFSLIVLGFSVAEINQCKDNFKCIPLAECEEIKSLIESNSLIDYLQSLSCGYFHEPYVCCARNCETPNGNYGNLMPLSNCSSLKESRFINDLNKIKFLNDSFINETHVCCGNNEDEYKLVEPAPIEDTDLNNNLLNSFCVTPNGEYGNCSHIYECPAYIEAAAEPNEYFRFINDSFCGYWEEPMVCCGNVSYYKETFASNLPNNNNCGLWNPDEGSKIPPWLVLISATGFVDVCVGALISPRYVLSTMLCTGKEYKKLTVRFGDCIGSSSTINIQCNAKVVQLKPFPLQNFVHSQDIGVVLIKLDKPVGSNSIPICLSSGPLPIFRQVKIVGLKKSNNTIVTDELLNALTTFTDDCYFGIHLKYLCMSSTDISKIRNKSAQQYMVVQMDNSNWYLEGLFNWRAWDNKTVNHFHSIYIHKFAPWIKSNIA